MDVCHQSSSLPFANVYTPQYGVGLHGQSIDAGASGHNLPLNWDARREWREMEQEEQERSAPKGNTDCEMDNAFTLSLAGGPALCLGKKKALCVLDGINGYVVLWKAPPTPFKAGGRETWTTANSGHTSESAI